MRAYLDNSATTAQSSEVTKAMIAAIEDSYGNPSSLHRMGVASEKLVKAARTKAAAAIGARDEEVYYTSGGTESDNTAIFGAAASLKRQGNHIITTKMEHPAVLECYKRLAQQGFDVTYLDVDSQGFVDMAQLESVMRDDTILVSVMHVNNETGAVQPIAEIGKTVKKSPLALFHCDAVQSYGKLPINVANDSIDLLAASGHKIHGPKGTGILYVKKDLHIQPLVCGGGQEKGMRAGTENVPGIIGFSEAADIAHRNRTENFKNVTAMRDHLLEGIRAEISDFVVNIPVDLVYKNNSEKGCLPHVLSISFLDTRGEVVLHMLEQAGIFVSTGSACSSNKKGQSHVLTAMGRSHKEIEGTVRFSLSPYNTMEEIEYTIDKLKKIIADHRKMMAIAARMGR